MFEMIYPIFAMILVSFSAMAGSFIAFFTKIEMDTYKKTIGMWWKALGITLFVFVLIGGFFIKDPITIALAVVALSAFIYFEKKNTNYAWIVLGVVLGFLFAKDLNFAYLASIMFAIFSFIYATKLTIPPILSKKKFMKPRIIEQIMFFVSGVIVYLALFKVF